jgi:hypothetical protein
LLILGRLGGLVTLAIFQDCVLRAERLGLDEPLGMSEIGRFVPHDSLSFVIEDGWLLSPGE